MFGVVHLIVVIITRLQLEGVHWWWLWGLFCLLLH